MKAIYSVKVKDKEARKTVIVDLGGDSDREIFTVSDRAKNVESVLDRDYLDVRRIVSPCHPVEYTWSEVVNTRKILG